MFPEAPFGGTTMLPTEAAFWMPGDDEIDANGFGGGYFQNTWLIKDVSVGDALDVLQIEREIADVVGRLASNEKDFDRLAYVAEFSSVDDTNEDLTDAERDMLRGVVPEFPELEGLELGVSGLAHALATAQMLPAASCRSHATSTTWSDAPVVLFATGEARARILQPFAAASGCTFDIDPARPALLTVRGRSISSTMDLAEAVIENRDAFI